MSEPAARRPGAAAALAAALAALAWLAVAAAGGTADGGPGGKAAGTVVGREVSVPRHLADGEELTLPAAELIAHGELLFDAVWTVQEGAGRPRTKGTGEPLSDPEAALSFPRNVNRISGPDASSCADCHHVPFGTSGGSGGVATNVFVLAQRFDFFELSDQAVPLRSSRDESGRRVGLGRAGNFRATTGMFGTGYLEALARQMTADLQEIRDSLEAGESAPLVSKGISFGILRRIADGRYDTDGVEGLAPSSLATWGADGPPSLIVAPFHQSGTVASLREFTVSALNHHHGIQAVERFGDGRDPDGDGVADELTRADVTALVLFQAALPVPGRVIPRDPAVEEAVLRGEELFARIGCARCHVPELPLEGDGHLFVEPGPFNGERVLGQGSGPARAIDLNDPALPPPRLSRHGDATWVPAFTDLKLHDITTGPDDPNREPLDINHRPGSAPFFAGNGRFLTKRLWGAANQPPYFHHGAFTTLREAVLAHAGEAHAEADAFRALAAADRDRVIEFIKTLQVLPPGTRARVVDETYAPRPWPPASRRLAAR